MCCARMFYRRWDCVIMCKRMSLIYLWFHKHVFNPIGVQLLEEVDNTTNCIHKKNSQLQFLK